MKIKNIACVGAGLIGQGWATVFSSRGYNLRLQDIDKSSLENSLKQVKSNLDFLEQADFIGPGEAEKAYGRITTTNNIAEAVDQADYVQESVPDDPALKQQVFKEIEAQVPDQAIIASSASGLLMTEIQQATIKPERCVLVHPSLPVHLVPLVEIVGGDQTSSETVTTSYEFMKELGKTPIRLKKEVPGYIINRLQAALLREAIDLVAQDVADAEDVDKAFCVGPGLRDPFMGPLLRAHLAGNGIESFLKNYHQSYQNRWKTMVTWQSVPPEAASAVIRGINQMEIVRRQSLDEIRNWRDRTLVKLIKVLNES